MAECQTIDVSEICGVASSQLSESLDDELEASVWGRLYPLHDSYSKVGNVLVYHHRVTQDTWVHGYTGLRNITKSYWSDYTEQQVSIGLLRVRIATHCYDFCDYICGN